MQPLKIIAAALRAGELNARDLLAAAAERHAALGATLAAYKTWAPEAARRAAEAADAAFAIGVDLGPLQGIPVSVKDHFGVPGLPVFAGTARRLPQKWEREGPVIARLRRQLAVITGKTHAVELAFGGIGLNNHWGTPRNPWDASAHRVPGGSSSGAGVSLIEGSALLALGTDTAGSVRIPASWTGTVGLKTSYGRWSLEGVVPLSPSLDTVGLLARSVADVIYGFAALDPEWGDAASALPTIGVGGRCFWEDCDPGVAEAVQAALQELEAGGMRLIDAELPEAEDAMALLRVGGIVSAECDLFVETELPDWRPLLDPIIASRIADGAAISAREYLLRRRRIGELGAAAAQRFAGLDVIAAPTVPITPPELEALANVEDYRRYNLPSLRNTCAANLLNLCAITLPAGLDRAGMPVGLMLMAGHGREERLLTAALAAESILGTADRRLGRPPLCPD